MTTQSWQNRLYRTLLRESQKSVLQRHSAFLAAGWLSLVGIKPSLPEQPSPTFTAIASGGVILVGILCLLGPILNVMQPAFRVLGALPAATWPLSAITSLFAWRYAAGRKVLSAFARMDGVL